MSLSQNLSKEKVQRKSAKKKIGKATSQGTPPNLPKLPKLPKK
jgi:hypothetical protein